MLPVGSLLTLPTTKVVDEPMSPSRAHSAFLGHLRSHSNRHRVDALALQRAARFCPSGHRGPSLQLPPLVERASIWEAVEHEFEHAALTHRNVANANATACAMIADTIVGRASDARATEHLRFVHSETIRAPLGALEESHAAAGRAALRARPVAGSRRLDVPAWLALDPQPHDM